MANNKLRYFILTGDPGVGKTTLIKKLSGILNENGVKTSGFYTEEVRNNRIREGFDVVTLDGNRGRLARDQTLLEGPVKFKVGKYGVLVKEFENIALESISKDFFHRELESASKHLLVIDEIGKMELFSDNFKKVIREIFDRPDSVVLATIPVRKGDPLVESIRTNSRGKVWTVTRQNRNNLHEEILREINKTLEMA